MEAITIEELELLRQKALSIVHTGDADEVIWMQARLMELAIFVLNSTGFMMAMGALDYDDPESEGLIEATCERMFATATVLTDVSKAILQYFEEDDE